MNEAVATMEEPPERTARGAPRAAGPRLGVSDLTGDPAGVAATARAWLESVPDLERRSLTPLTRARLADSRRITSELVAVLAGDEPGEGEASARVLLAAHAAGRVQGLAAAFACPGAVFIELLATAPWNLLGPDDPRDLRTVRGAGTALLGHAAAWSASTGAGGALALQAENPRTLAFYERLGFRRMGAGDLPLSRVPRGAGGWSDSIVRVAAGRPGAEEARSPWLLLPAGVAGARLVAG